MKLLFTGILMAFALMAANAQTSTFNCYVDDPGGHIRAHNADFISLDLALEFAPEDGKVSGVANYTFKAIQPATDSVFLDGPGILIDAVTFDGGKAKYHSDSAGITIFFDPPLERGAPHTLSIQYTAYPKKGIYFNGWKSTSPDSETDPTRIRKQIWTQGQGVDNRFWFPCYDTPNDKLVTSLEVTFDEAYTVISNGYLAEKKINGNKTITWTYHMGHPHATYLVMLAIGKYDYIDYTSRNGIVSRQYYYPGTKKTAELTYQFSAEMMDFIEGEAGIHFPWETYANVPVQEFLYGAMENTTATIFSDYFYQDARTFPDKNYTDINAHELTHQWFGDYITAWSSEGQWLQESFATYYAKKFREHIDGEDAYQWKRRDEMNTAFDAETKNNFPVAHSAAGSQRVYQKGSIVLDMLRYVLGDAQFKIVIKEYLQSYPYGNVETKDLQMQCMRSLGINMDWFFDEWIYRNGYPEYAVRYTTGADGTDVSVNQTQKQTETLKLFKMPVHIQVHYLDGNFDDRLVTIEKDSTFIHFPNTENKKVAFVLFDPNSMVYAKVDFPKPYTEIKYQAFNAPNMIDRYDAVVMMRGTDISDKRDDLLTLLEKEKFYGIRSEIIAQLSNDDNKKSIAAIAGGLHDKNPLIRRAALTNMKEIPQKLVKDVEAILADSNYLNIEVALYKLSTQFPDNQAKYLAATDHLFGTNNNIRITWLEIACASEMEKHIGELVHFTSADYEFRTRVYAISSLQDMLYCDEDVVANLFDAALSTNNRLASPARTALIKFKETPAYAAMIKKYYQENIWDDWQTRKLSPVMQ